MLLVWKRSIIISEIIFYLNKEHFNWFIFKKLSGKCLLFHEFTVTTWFGFICGSMLPQRLQGQEVSSVMEVYITLVTEIPIFNSCQGLSCLSGEICNYNYWKWYNWCGWRWPFIHGGLFVVVLLTFPSKRAFCHVSRN
jgi:hypothetical protein